MLRKGMHQRPGHDEMVEHPDVHEIQGLDEGARQAQVGFARFRQAGRVVVREDHPGRVV